MPHQCTSCGRTFEDGSKQMLSGCPDCGGNKFQFQPAGAANASAGGASGGSDAGGGTASAATAPKKTPENARSARDAQSRQTEADARSSATETQKTGGADAPETGGDDRASAVDRAAATVRDWVGKRDGESSRTERSPQAERSNRTERSTRTDAGGGPTDSPRSPEGSASGEDSAQASARRAVVSESELPDEPPQSAAAEAPADPDDAAVGEADANVVDTPDDQSPGLKELREELNSQFESIRIVEPGQYELNLMELYEREEYIISLREDGKYIIEVPDAWDAPDR